MSLSRALPTASLFSPAPASAPKAAYPPSAHRDGLWAGYNVEEICTPDALRRNPALVWEFYSKRRADCAKAEPNPAHVALAELESQLSGRYFLCTQNVDDLHERAGCEISSTCMASWPNRVASASAARPPVEDRAVYASLDEVARCACGGRLRPHIVFFGEIPLEMPRIEREISDAP